MKLNNTIYKIKSLLRYSSFFKASIASIIFLLLFSIHTNNFIREVFEDVAFDFTSKLALSIWEQDTVSPLVTVFTFDNTYMVNHGLFDSDGNNNPNSSLGYFFPREKIVQFIDELDTRINKLEGHCPKALFIDLELDFATGVNGQLSIGDDRLLTKLKRKRCYRILLPKNGKHHFIEEHEDESNDISIQQLIEDKQIIIVSSHFHIGSDNVIRRYEPTKIIDGTHYPSAAIALWQIIRNHPVDANKASAKFIDDTNGASQKNEGIFKFKNVNANMIWIKKYKLLGNTALPFPHNSVWGKLEKYSLASRTPNKPLKLPLNAITDENFKETVIILGGTYQKNPEFFASTDYHQILNFSLSSGVEKMSGVDIHANILMTMLHLDGAMKQMFPLVSSLIIFIVIFLIDLINTYVFKSSELEQIAEQATFIISTVFLFCFSLYLLQSKYHIWFNWSVPLILFEFIEISIFVIKYIPKYLRKINFTF